MSAKRPGNRERRDAFSTVCGDTIVTITDVLQREDMNCFIRLGAAVVASALVLFAAAAQAQDFPSKTIRLIAPYAAGGGNDLMARTLAEGMAKILKRPVIVENRAGAGGSIGI